MINYESAKQYYKGRKDRFQGRKIATNLYMKYDPEGDCYLVNEVASRWVKNIGYGECTRAKPEHWEMRYIATIYQDRIEMVAPMSITNLRKVFGIRCERSSSIKVAGRIWTLGSKRYQGELPFTILPDKSIKFKNENKVRQFDQDKRKELNDQIKKVRTLIKVRYKLGAFSRLTFRMLADAIKDHPDFVEPNFYTYHDAHMLLSILKGIDENDITSMYPLLFLCSTVHYQEHFNSDAPINEGLMDRLNALIKRNREGLRKLSGAVGYVEKTGENGQVEATRSA